MKQNTSWGEVSDWYDVLLESDPDSYQVKVILPNLLRIINPTPGMTVFDNACGQGFFSRAMAKVGANVVSADISKELIEKAIEKEKFENIEYNVSPADKAPFLSEKSVDVEMIVLALQNIRSIEPVFTEAKRVLSDSGRLVFVLNHPAFRIPKASSWGFDEESQVQYRRVDSYMSESSSEIVMNPGQTAKETIKTVSFHRPLQVYIKALAKAGFVVTRFEEWISHKKSEPGARQSAEDTSRKEIPLFLCIEAEKKLQ